MSEPVDAVAFAIISARDARRCLSAPFGGRMLDPDEAYLVQDLVVASRLGRGERVVGWKLGYTSSAMREQMGISEPNHARLTDAMLLADGALLPETVIQPRVEPEIALEIAADVTAAVDARGIRAKVARARCALEVVDSVWCDYRFDWADNTADGSSAAFVVLGPELPQPDLASVRVDLVRNGEPAGTGCGADAMGDPFAALAWLSDRLLERGQHLAAGDVVITGGLVRAVPLAPGDIVQAVMDGCVVSVRRAVPPGVAAT
jgi:2-keto-4-pentenoate hydratase